MSVELKWGMYGKPTYLGSQVIRLAATELFIVYTYRVLSWWVLMVVPVKSTGNVRTHVQLPKTFYPLIVIRSIQMDPHV